MRIFVSYTLKDTIINRKSLCMVSGLLMSCGKPFIDHLHNNSSNRQFRVSQELHSADVLIFLDSNSAKESKWVCWELKQAQNLNIPIIRIRIDNNMSLDEFENAIKENLCFIIDKE
jgi:hypothetical protein